MLPSALRSGMPAGTRQSTCQLLYLPQVCSRETGRLRREEGHTPSGLWRFSCCLLSSDSSCECHPGNASSPGGQQVLKQHLHPVGQFLHPCRTSLTKVLTAIWLAAGSQAHRHPSEPSQSTPSPGVCFSSVAPPQCPQVSKF